MNPESQPSKSFLISIIIAALAAGALVTLKLPRHADPAAPVVIQPSPLAAVLNPPGIVVVVSRPWVQRDTAAMFDFNDHEWQELTNSYAEKVTGPTTLKFSQGTVERVSQGKLKAMLLTDPAATRTNMVWFYR